jgi:cytochrome c peroxidase|nr:cytochrome c peroxidase [Kofleriaceae bacterium]
MRIALVVVAPVVLAVAACGGKPADTKAVEVVKKDGGAVVAPIDARPAPLIALPAAPPLPAVPPGLPALPDSPTIAAITPDALALGELLFFDPRLAADNKTACATCHDPAHDYAGPIDATASDERNARRTPTLANLAWKKQFGWDGRYDSLADLLPVHVRGQQGNELADAVGRIADLPGYRAHLARVGGAATDAAISALSAFVLTRYDGGAPWDRLEDAAKRPPANGKPDDVTAGYLLFVGKAQCGACHTPPLYTDLGFHRVRSTLATDPGRGKVDPNRVGAFATPTLRGAANRVELFHDGAAHDLDGAVAMSLAPPVPGDKLPIDEAAQNIQLAPAEAAQLVAFIRALSNRPLPSPQPRPTLP